MAILKKQYGSRTGCMQHWRSQPRGACHRDYSHLLSGGRVYVPLCPSYQPHPGRKKQLTFIGVLVALIFALNSVAVIFPGLFAVLPIHLPAMAFLLLVPLAIVLAGLLWSWPENHAGITTEAALCSLIVTVAGFALAPFLDLRPYGPACSPCKRSFRSGCSPPGRLHDAGHGHHRVCDHSCPCRWRLQAPHTVQEPEGPKSS